MGVRWLTLAVLEDSAAGEGDDQLSAGVIADLNTGLIRQLCRRGGYDAARRVAQLLSLTTLPTVTSTTDYSR